MSALPYNGMQRPASGDAGQHSGPDLFAIVEGEDEIRPIRSSELWSVAPDRVLESPDELKDLIDAC